MYKHNQTGKKIQEGGVKDGFSRKRYQFSTEGAVNIEPIAPANWPSNAEARSFKKLTLLTISYLGIILYSNRINSRIEKTFSLYSCLLQHFCKVYTAKRKRSNRAKKFTPFRMSFNELYYT